MTHISIYMQYILSDIQNHFGEDLKLTYAESKTFRYQIKKGKIESLVFSSYPDGGGRAQYSLVEHGNRNVKGMDQEVCQRVCSVSII